MLDEFLKEVVGSVAGKQSEDIVKLLDKNKYVNEFIIAKKLDITVNQTRNILYKLADQGIVSHTRKKDEKKGWYTYFWKIEIVKALEFLDQILDKRIDQFRNQIKSRETKLFYVCEKCSIEMNEENALLNDFTCNECGEVFSLKDNSKVLREMKRNLVKLEREKKGVVEEILKEKTKEDKKKAKEKEKEAKEKKRIRDKKRKAKEKENKKKVKKPVKKKAVKKKKVVKKKKPVKKTSKKNKSKSKKK